MTASQTLTPTQARLMGEHKARRERFAAKAKPDTPILCLSASARSQRAEVPPVILPEPMPAPAISWGARQIQLYEPWFSIEREIEAPAWVNPAPSMRAIQRICAAFYSMTVIELLADRRILHIVRARQVAIFLCREFTMRSMPEIGRCFGGRDHTTILHAIRKITKLESENSTLAADLKALRERIRAAA